MGSALLLPLKEREWDRTFRGISAVLASSAVCKLTKLAVPARRPNGEDNKSFPSQHAAECFAAGLALRRQFDRDVGAIAIGAATFVSMTRLYAGKHHLRDVLAGLVIGAVSTIAVQAYEGRAK